MNGDGAMTAEVTLYGSNGADDIHAYTGYTMTSDPEQFGYIDEGVYDGEYAVPGKSGALSSHWLLSGRIPEHDGAINPNNANQKMEMLILTSKCLLDVY